MDTSDIQFRHFRNYDPPELLRLWNESFLGRGAAADFTCDALDHFVFSQPYFDHHGLILAEHEGRPVGFVHAGFGCDSEERRLCTDTGVICAVIVHPKFRRQGIGRRLIAEADKYLDSKGAKRILFGAPSRTNPFYVGLYGGTEPAGFMESDEAVVPFAQALGLVEVERYLIFQRNMNHSRDPIAMRLMQNKRKFALRLMVGANKHSWWWAARFGRLDSVTAILEPKSGEGNSVARAHCYGLDLYISKWGDRSVGVRGIEVSEENRRKGYAQTLLVELCARMKREMIPIIDVHAAATDEPTISLLKSSGFTQVDTGIVFGRIDSNGAA